MTTTAANPDIKTLADLQQFLRNDASCSQSARQNMVSAINRFCKVAGPSPAEVMADPGAVRRLREDAAWQLHDLTKNRWSNIVSLVNRALIQAGIEVHRGRRTTPRSEEWQLLYDRLPDRSLQHGLSRFTRWASAMAIGPGDVDAETFERFRVFLEEMSTCTMPRERWHVARRAWNRAVDTVPGWPGERVPGPLETARQNLTWDDFPASVRAEKDDYACHRTKVSARRRRKGQRPLKKGTVRQHLDSWRCLASRLADGGYIEPDKIEHLLDVLRPDLVDGGLDRMMDGQDPDDVPWSVVMISQAAVSMARFLGAPEGDVRALEEIAKDYRHHPTGMCENNRRKLAPLEDEETRCRLLELPVVLTHEFRSRKAPTVRDAQQMQLAVAIEILLMAPMRVGNLAMLELEEHVTWSGPGRTGQLRIHLDKSVVKNNTDLNFVLPEESTALVNTYIERFRPLLADEGTMQLFVSQTGRAKGAHALSKQISKTIKRRLGLDVHAHLLRHFAVYNYLREHPEDYETPRRMLSHKSIETTTHAYAGLETEHSIARYDDIVLRQRAKRLRTGGA